MQTNNTINLDFACEYKIDEIIFVNSGSNYYVRLPVNSHAALISDNNSGKTSSLSALKLFLLPEISFKKQVNKFGFHSGGKFYTDLSSYTYYFPGSESYIICSASNPKGNFCWILYRTTDLRYERIAVPYDYDSIMHLFWNENSKRNENAGELHPQIDVSYIKKKLISDFKGRIFTEKKEIGEAIYTRASNVDNDSKFCLLPMAKGYSSNITETIRSLLSMAFSLSNASTTSLPTAIASILDGAGMSAVRKSNSEGIFLDLDAQLDEWRELKDIDSRLKLIDSHKKNWECLQESRREYERLKLWCRDNFKKLAWSISTKHIEISSLLEELQKNFKKADEELSTYVPTYQSAKDNYRQANSDNKSARKALTDINTRIECINQVRSQYKALCPNDDNSDRMILDALEEQIQLYVSEIEGLKDQAKALQMMETLNKQINSNKYKREELSKAINSLESETSFLDALSIQTASTMLSLNHDFANLCFTPTAEENAVIESFASLFSVKDGRMTFCGSTLVKTEFIERNNKAVIKKLEIEISELDILLAVDGRQLIRLKKNCELTKELQDVRLRHCTEELGELKNKKSSLQAANELESMRLASEETLGLALEKFEQAKCNLESAETERTNLETARNLINVSISEHQFPLKLVEEQRKQLEYIEGISTLLNIEQSMLEFDPQLAGNLTTENLEQDLNKLHEELKRALSKRTDCTNSMAFLLDYKIVESSPEERHQITMSKDKFLSFYSDLQTVFLNFDKSRENYKERLAHHNNTAAAASRMIENVEGIVKSFIKGVNDELKGYKISNLNSVELVAELHPQYTNMVKSLSRVGSRTDELLSESFYKQISDFQENFYIKNPGKIEIAKIIEGISYRFERNTAVEDDPQSNGTNCMVNAALLALFLKKLIPEDLSLTVPVIFDEVGSLDVNNLNEILKVMEEHNLFLFTANPEQNGVIASVLDVYHNLSVFKATDVLVQGKAEAIYYPYMDERLEDINEHNDVSISLL